MISIQFVTLMGLISVLLVSTVHSNGSNDPNYSDQRPHIISGGGSKQSKKTLKYSSPKTSITIVDPTTPLPPNILCSSVELDLSRMGLIRLDESVIQSPGVVHLNFSYNKIAHVARTAFTKLPDLVTLDMSRNKIPLPKLLQYSDLNKLENLYLDENNGTKNGRTIFESDSFPRLRKLSMRGNYIKVFDLVLRQVAPRLTYLDLSQNNISSNNFIANFPDTLTHLFMNDNLIEEVKISQSVLPNIEVLSMSRNNFEVLCFKECSTKATFQVTNVARLKDLDLSGNEIAEIHGVYDHSRCKHQPSSHPNFHSLSYINLSHNKLQLIGDHSFCGIRSLQTLLLDHNKLSSFPDICSWPQLRNLDLSYNNIDVIDTSSCVHWNLEVLNLSGNKISSIHYAAFHTHNKLQEVDLSNNRIVELPNDWINPSSSLRVLRLTNNLISDLDRISFSGMTSLRDLHIENNPLLKVNLRALCTVTQLSLHIRLLEDAIVVDRNVDDTDDNDIDDDSSDTKAVKSGWSPFG